MNYFVFVTQKLENYWSGLVDFVLYERITWKIFGKSNGKFEK